MGSAGLGTELPAFGDFKNFITKIMHFRHISTKILSQLKIFQEGLSTICPLLAAPMLLFPPKSQLKRKNGKF